MDIGQTPPETLSVSQLNRQVKRLLETSFDFVWVEGEISNFVQPASGHWYFSLKDGSAQVRCAMFRNRNQRVRLRPENGQQVRLRARVSLYEGRGEFQLIGEHLEPAGAGALQLAFEQLKQALQAEGLFDQERKQPLPQMPRHIGVITSPTGAAIRDILTVFRRRFPAIAISVLPVPVQGEMSAPAIVAALAQAQSRDFDALILARGGGSIEDLWSFNEEAVARAIAASNLPVVSAVGHEIDFTIADFVADARAPTPSAAAEMLSPDQAALQRHLDHHLQRMLSCVTRNLREGEVSLVGLRRRLRHPGERLQEQAQRLDDAEQRLQRAVALAIRTQQQRLALSRTRLQANSPAEKLARLRLRLDHQRQRLAAASRAVVEHTRSRLGRAAGILESLSPLSTLERGYALVTDDDGNVVTDADLLQPGQRVKTRLARGDFRSEVLGDD